MADNDDVVNHEVLHGVGEHGGRVGVARVLQRILGGPRGTALGN